MYRRPALALLVAMLVFLDRGPVPTEFEAYAAQSSPPRAMNEPEQAAILGVIGTDDRRQITPAIGTVYSPVLRVVVAWPSGATSRCSGFAAGRRTAVTAAHCVYDTAQGGYARTVTVFAGANGSLEPPLASAQAVETRVPPEWLDARPAGLAGRVSDYAGLQLDWNMGDVVGSFSGVLPVTDAALDGATLTAIGYPLDKPEATMWEGEGPADPLTDAAFLVTTADMTDGQSGGPILRRSPGGNSGLAGIIIGGVSRTEGGTTETGYNVGVRLSSVFSSRILAWLVRDNRIAETAAAPPSTPPPTALGRLTGAIPPPGGISLGVFSGGSSAALLRASNCALDSAAFWTSDGQGGFLQYVPGTSIGVVNAAWESQFSRGIPAGTAVLFRCSS